MQDVLNNPVFHALSSGDEHLGFGTDKVKAFDEEVSPFAGYDTGYEKALDDLWALLPSSRYVLLANPEHIEIPGKWKLIQKVEGIQMIYSGEMPAPVEGVDLVPLGDENIDEMVALAKLTQPGPFAQRTIEFGNYYGIFCDGKLVAMTGQRMHVGKYIEVSAVCTHPDYVGRGYASALVRNEVRVICAQGKTPYLHVRADNDGAIRVYERIGFVLSRPMNFYFMKKRV